MTEELWAMVDELENRAWSQDLIEGMILLLPAPGAATEFLEWLAKQPTEITVKEMLLKAREIYRRTPHPDQEEEYM